MDDEQNAAHGEDLGRGDYRRRIFTPPPDKRFVDPFWPVYAGIALFLIGYIIFCSFVSTRP